MLLYLIIIFIIIVLVIPIAFIIKKKRDNYYNKLEDDQADIDDDDDDYFVLKYDNLSTANLKGKLGESTVSRAIKKSLKKNEYLINDYRFYDKNSSVQIDHIAIKQNGIFIIETKNHVGHIFGKDEDKTWTQVLHRKKFKLYNPVKQNLSHMYHVKNILKYNTKYLFPFVVFANSKVNLSNVKSKYTLDIYKLENLLNRDTGISLSEPHRYFIHKKLMENQKFISMKEHIENINLRINKN